MCAAISPFNVAMLCRNDLSLDNGQTGESPFPNAVTNNHVRNPRRNICDTRDRLSRAFGMVTAAQPIVLFCRSAHKSRQVHDVVFHKQHRLGRMTALFAAATVPQQRVFFGKVLVHRCLGSIHCMFLPFCCAVATLIKRHSVLSALLWSHHQHRLKPHRPILLN